MTLFNARLGCGSGTRRGPRYDVPGPRGRRGRPARGGLRLTDGERRVREPLRRRPLRQPRPLRDGPPPLPLHPGLRREPGRRVPVRRPRERDPEDPHRPRHPDRLRRRVQHPAEVASGGAASLLLRPRHDQYGDVDAGAPDGTIIYVKPRCATKSRTTSTTTRARRRSSRTSPPPTSGSARPSSRATARSARRPCSGCSTCSTGRRRSRASTS